jgi:proteic killer suppression protein
MIQTFSDKKTADLFQHERVKQFEKFERIALRKLEMIHAAISIADLKVPPGNKLEKLRGSKSAYHSIRINDQWRISFIWKESHAYDVKIEDYH